MVMHECCCCGRATAVARMCMGLNLEIDKVLGTDLAIRYHGITCYGCSRVLVMIFYLTCFVQARLEALRAASQ